MSRFIFAGAASFTPAETRIGSPERAYLAVALPLLLAAIIAQPLLLWQRNWLETWPLLIWLSPLLAAALALWQLAWSRQPNFPLRGFLWAANFAFLLHSVRTLLFHDGLWEAITLVITLNAAVAVKGRLERRADWPDWQQRMGSGTATFAAMTLAVAIRGILAPAPLTWSLPTYTVLSTDGRYEADVYQGGDGQTALVSLRPARYDWEHWWASSEVEVADVGSNAGVYPWWMGNRQLDLDEFGTPLAGFVKTAWRGVTIRRRAIDGL